MAQGARRGRTIASAPCTPALWRQNRRFAVPSAYAFRLSGRARGNIPVKPRPQPTSLWAAPASRQRFGDSDATYAAVAFLLTVKISVAGTDESPLEIGDPRARVFYSRLSLLVIISATIYSLSFYISSLFPTHFTCVSFWLNDNHYHSHLPVFAKVDGVTHLRMSACLCLFSLCCAKGWKQR